MAMVSYKGRTSLLQYMKNKPNKWGMKSWVLAGGRSGYTFEWKIYEGKEDDQHNTGYGVVWSLSQNLQPGQNLFVNNFFNSVALCSDLKDRGIGCCGTVRAIRVDNPPQLKVFKKGTPKRTLEELSPLFLRNQTNGVLAVGWQDKRPVTVLSTIDGAGSTRIRMRGGRGPDGHREVEKPNAIVNYNNYMGGWTSQTSSTATS